MSAIVFLIIIGIVVAGGFVIAFIWAVRSGQYDDDFTPSVRILFDPKKTAEQGSADAKVEKGTETKQEQS